ncbi:MAG: hypothetical protein WD354_00440, partial [Acidimicrobiia bacterium]
MQGNHGLIGRRVVGGASLLSLLLALQLVTAGTATAATLTVAPNSAPPGESIVIKGSAFVALLEVDVCWDQPGCDNLGSRRANPNGTFTVEAVVPLAASLGTHPIYACQLSGLVPVCTSASFVVLEPTTTTIIATTTTAATTTTIAPTTTTNPTT